MRATNTERTRPAREPFPWFLLVLFALIALGIVATSSVRIYRYHLEDSIREERWRVGHEALLREVSEYTPAP